MTRWENKNGVPDDITRQGRMRFLDIEMGRDGNEG